MSVQFGRWNFDGKPVDPKDLDEVRPVLAPYGPDGEGYICRANFAVLYRAFHTTKESRRETQPYVSASGFVLTWDGRLDNREELIGGIGGEISCESTDLEIVAAGFQRWGTDAFAKLIGDWALSIFDPKDRSLILAKDFVGTRHLYYTIDSDEVTWCTILDPLVLLAKRPLKLEEEYIAGWLSFFPATHLTPYVGVHSVPSSSFARVTRGVQEVRRFWDFDPAKRIRYRTDAEYEEHFRLVFGESVRRRLRSDSRILAELSGGMDSSSIVCMADEIITAGQAVHCRRLDTVSYFSDSEANWNERPYFQKIEEKRGHTGLHVDVAQETMDISDLERLAFAVTPACISCTNDAVRQIAARVHAQGNRVLLSGVGGDEVTGGVPTPVPELADLIAAGRFGALAHQLKNWALSQRKPWFHLLREALMRFLPPLSISTPQHRRPARWLTREFTKRHVHSLGGYQGRLRLAGAPPSFQENLFVLDGVRRQLACEAPSCQILLEKCYPYLDRSLLEFLYAVPREQIVRPGQRRSLMRRSLVGIVPDEVLNRRRKAYVTRSPEALISTYGARLAERSETMLAASFGIVDPSRFRESVRRVCQGDEMPIVTLVRTLAVESWLHCVQHAVTPPRRSIEVSRTNLLTGKDTVATRQVHATTSSWLAAQTNATERR